MIELMIVVVIAGILATIAWPSFQDAIRKGRRSDAMAGLSKIVQAQERWRANHPFYQDALADLNGATANVSDGGHYTLSVQVDDATKTSNYIAKATVRSTVQTADSNCQILQITNEGGNIKYSSYASGDSANSPDPCWVR